MSTGTVISLLGMVAVVAGSAGINFFGAAAARSTSDFLVASRTLGPATNAAAISGEYLSAASFLGVAGLVMRDGADALWYPVGFTAGYLALLLFVAAPLRRSGAYTVPDFAELRLRSQPLRRVCTLVTIVLGWLFMLPQLQGAALTVATISNLPSWSGAAAASVVVLATVLFGGLRSMTLVQAFQYFLKLAALAVPTVVLALHFAGTHPGLTRPTTSEFTATTTLDIRAAVALQIGAPVEFTATGELDGAQRAGAVRWEPGTHTVSAGSSLSFPAGTPIPLPVGVAPTDSGWLNPLSGSRQYPLVATYSLIMALVLGTMGLPSVLARFYSNPDGHATRRTAVIALALVGGFYLLPIALGVLSRFYTPQLLLTGQSDAAVLLLPAAALGSGWAMDLLTGLITAGAWAAFLSAATGLAVSVAGVIHTDVLRRGRAHDFRLAALIATAVPLGAALLVTRLELTETVALAFAVAASTFCPLLVLGIWWRGLTAPGAIAGILTGAALSITAAAAVLAGLGHTPGLGDVLSRPAIISAPAAFLTMIVVSRLTARRSPTDAEQLLLQLHAPERLGLTPPHVPEAPDTATRTPPG